MERLELKKNRKAVRVKRQPSNLQGKRRVSVSQAKAHLSAVLKQVQSGQSIIVTDHGKDIACIERIQEANKLRIIPPQRPFSEVKDIRAPIPADSRVAHSILDLLKEDRDSR